MTTVAVQKKTAPKVDLDATRERLLRLGLPHSMRPSAGLRGTQS